MKKVKEKGMPWRREPGGLYTREGEGGVINHGWPVRKRMMSIIEYEYYHQHTACMYHIQQIATELN